MKKKLSKKLSLNKKTVVNLDEKSMKNLQGGYEQSIARTNCPLCFVVVTETCSCAESACCPESFQTDCPSLCSNAGQCC